MSLLKSALTSLHNTLFYLFCFAPAALTYANDGTNTNQDSDWPYYGRDYTNQRYSPLDQINTGNIQNLKLVWRYHTGKVGTFQASPIIVNGVMYISTPFNDVIALDAASGKALWHYRHKLESEDFCCGPANRGVAVGHGKVYIATIDARLIALDQDNGKVLWDIPITDPHAGKAELLEPLLGVKELDGAVQTGQTGYTANLAPQIYDGKLFVGISGAGYGLHMEFEEDGDHILSVGGLSGGGHGLRGFIVAYDAETGKEHWRWYTVPESGWEGAWRETTPDGELLHRDIADEQADFEKYADTWRYGGGSIYTTPAVDPDLGLIYFGTGNPSPQMDDTTRPGDNLHTVSLIALDANTGEIKWHYQQVPHDRWGYDIASPPVLFDFKKDGKIIKAVGQASKLGWFYIHDRMTGELLLRSDAFIQQENLFAKPTEDGVRIVPGTLGASSWSPVAYHPELDAVFISGIYQPSLFFSRKLDPEPGKPWQSYTFFRQADEDDWGNFTAISTTTGKILWQQNIDDPMVGGSIATAGNLVFTGEGNGFFNAFNAATGERLWQYKSEFGVNAPPVSYAINGKQYIAVAAGGNSLFGYPVGDEVMVFSLESE